MRFRETLVMTSLLLLPLLLLLLVVVVVVLVHDGDRFWHDVLIFDRFE